LNESMHNEPFLLEWDGKRSVSQIDFVPTFSLLSSTKIPFSNLGSIIPELFLDSRGGRDPASRLISATRENSVQIYNYIAKYSTYSRDLDFRGLSDLYTKAEHSYTLHLSKKSNPHTTPQQLLESSARVYVDHTVFQRTCLSSARQVWAKFNETLMMLGLVILATSFVYNVFAVRIINMSDSLMIGAASMLCAGAVYFLNTSASSSVHETEATNLQLGIFVFSMSHMLISIFVSKINLSFGIYLPISNPSHILQPYSSTYIRNPASSLPPPPSRPRIGFIFVLGGQGDILPWTNPHSCPYNSPISKQEEYR
jgi:hypothetical protein